MADTKAPAPLPRTLLAVLRPFQEFFRASSASGVMLLGATIVALAWANSPYGASYDQFVGRPLAVEFGPYRALWPLRQWVNDALMAVFFLLVGIEIKRELVVGELRTPRRAILPAIAALGGMLVPAGIYALINRGGPGQPGWGIPMATDIAFALACVSLVKTRVAQSLAVFLTALAIFDDLGAVLVIALFYGHGFNAVAFAIACGVTGVLVCMNRFGVRKPAAYLIAGFVLWVFVLRSGIHATIAGVVLGICIPAPSPLDRLEHALNKPVAFVIVPLFALVNAGVHLHGVSLPDLAAPIPLGIALGLFVGKQVGVLGFTLLAIRTGLAPKPRGATLRQLHGISILAGIGFTMSLFIADLAFGTAEHLTHDAKLGILVASAVSALLGVGLLRLGGVTRLPL